MQATVAHFDPDTGEGSVLLDDGVRLTFTRTAVAEGVRLLRLGQRVELQVEGTGAEPVIRSLRLVTVGG